MWRTPLLLKLTILRMRGIALCAHLLKYPICNYLLVFVYCPVVCCSKSICCLYYCCRCSLCYTTLQMLLHFLAAVFATVIIVITISRTHAAGFHYKSPSRTLSLTLHCTDFAVSDRYLYEKVHTASLGTARWADHHIKLSPKGSGLIWSLVLR